MSGLDRQIRNVQTGDLIVLDGREGVVYINPGPEVESAYRKLQREYVHLRDQLIENRELPAITRDGLEVDLLANVNGPPDALAAVQVGAGGVGLYRTEYLFLTHQAVPNEDEQLAMYSRVIQASPGRAVTVRTLDLGGDKQVPYLGNHREANPFMGWRSIRLSTEYPEFFQTQLRHPPGGRRRANPADVPDGFNLGGSAATQGVGETHGGHAPRAGRSVRRSGTLWRHDRGAKRGTVHRGLFG